MKKISLLLLGIPFLFTECKTNKNTALQNQTSQTITQNQPPIESIKKPAVYRESRERKIDLLHMRLWISFNYEKQYAYAKAILKMKPYFYPQKQIELDARGFEIKEIGLVSSKNINAQKAEKPLNYQYQNDIITIDLDKTYYSTDTLNIFINYIAKPNELKEGGSNAISSDKGLFFINPLGTEDNKPRQIWTQGETQSNSAWFPTIDSPNEKITHELFITVQNNEVTLSNGLLIASTDNKDGTRTDFWKMDMPHAPYLVMMAIGEFAVVKDKWRNIPVNYYVEKEYSPHAKAIFGNTPEMIEYFSKILGFDYPWPKYSQVIVRDYVSGVMENTTATIHGEFVQKTTRELIDGNNDEIIAHELFHQWFGDVVTCESWSNLPLNESFATYGEYLWEEYKNGRDAADAHNQQGLLAYLAESRQKQVNMIRFDWQNREDMFDSHSYAKGGRILHMLRKTVGDSAFFKSLNLYLTKNKFRTVEIHDLRLAFEEVTGQDLNWFFNQWFFAPGHPKIKITHQFNPETNLYTVSVKQSPSAENGPLYRLPFDIDIYSNNTVTRHRVTLTDSEQNFEFKLNQKPDLVNVDAEKMLLCVKEEKKTNQEWAFQYKKAPLYLDRVEALENLSKNPNSPEAQEIIELALNDRYWGIARKAIELTGKLPEAKRKTLRNKLEQIATNNPQSALREIALYTLADQYGSAMPATFFENIITTDSSYSVQAACIYGLKKVDSAKTIQVCKQLEKEKNSDIILTIADVYKDIGTKEQNQFFINNFKKLNGFSRYGLIQSYSQFLTRMDHETVNSGIPIIENLARTEKVWWIRLSGIQALNSIAGSYERKEAELKNKIETSSNKNVNELNELKTQLAAIENQRKKIDSIINDIKKNEKDPNLTRFWNSTN
jgi:aminopeptidase N